VFSFRDYGWRFTGAWVTVNNVLYIWDYHTEGEDEGGREGGERR